MESNMGWTSDLINDLTLSGRPVEPTGTTQTLGSLSQTTSFPSGHVISNSDGTWTWATRGDTDPYTGRPTLRTQLMMRLDPTGKHEGMQLFEFIQVHKCRDDLYAVFVVKNGTPLIIEDGDLFPSDTLITKLRLMMG